MRNPTRFAVRGRKLAINVKEGSVTRDGLKHPERRTPHAGTAGGAPSRACRSEDRRYAPKTEGKSRSLARSARMRHAVPFVVRGRKLARMRKEKGRTKD